MTRERDTTEYISMLRRMIRAGGRRVAESDEYELAEFIELQDILKDTVKAAVAGQRAMGKSWADIATATGTTRQAAQERYGR